MMYKIMAAHFTEMYARTTRVATLAEAERLAHRAASRGWYVTVMTDDAVALETRPQPLPDPFAETI